jgi:pimeloyl-ACP methyl ester carboxylesterase
MSEPRLNHVQCLAGGALHRMAYWEWGDPANRNVVVCVHGISRQGRDFDTLAQALADRYRVVCPDIVGRGRSDWLDDPRLYAIAQYISDVVALLARLDADAVDWVGTSMGGLIGIGVAALRGSPLRRLVLNDVGPTIEASALARIGAYLGAPLRWDSVEAATDYVQSISASFGPHTREQWLTLTRPMLALEDGRYRLHYDPRIGEPLRAMTPEFAALGEAALWAAYDAIRCPTLLLRGAESDLLRRDIALAMTERGPRARLHEFAGVGHAPMLVVPDQLAVVREFLSTP